VRCFTENVWRKEQEQAVYWWRWYRWSRFSGDSLSRLKS